MPRPSPAHKVGPTTSFDKPTLDPQQMNCDDSFLASQASLAIKGQIGNGKLPFFYAEMPIMRDDGVT
jgi:hypothetical protein